MTIKRKILLAIAITATALFLAYAVLPQRSEFGPGEVGVVLVGASKVLALYIAGFCAILAAIAALWQYRKVRLGFVGAAMLMIIVPAGAAVWNQIADARHDKYWKDKRANNEIVAAKIVARYDEQLDKQGDDIAKLIDLRTRLQDEIYTQDLGWASGGSQDFYWKHSLYIWIFADEIYPAHEKAFIDMGYAAPDDVCDQFYKQYREKFVEQQRAVNFRKYCPRTVGD